MLSHLCYKIDSLTRLTMAISLLLLYSLIQVTLDDGVGPRVWHTSTALYDPHGHTQVYTFGGSSTSIFSGRGPSYLSHLHIADFGRFYMHYCMSDSGLYCFDYCFDS